MAVPSHVTAAMAAGASQCASPVVVSKELGSASPVDQRSGMCGTSRHTVGARRPVMGLFAAWQGWLNWGSDDGLMAGTRHLVSCVARPPGREARWPTGGKCGEQRESHERSQFD